MIKKFILFTIFASFLFLGFIFVSREVESPEKILGEQNPVSHNPKDFDLDNNLSYYYFEVDDMESLKLMPNFTEKLTSKEFVEKYKCRSLVNGGFYSKDNEPIGLFITEGEKLKAWSENSLLDGIFSVNYFGIPRITREIPSDELRITVQSGPILIENTQVISLSLNKDEFARRVVAAVTGENRIYFIVFYDKGSEFSGPRLTDLPRTLEVFQKKAGITIADAINLDGGTASTFIVENVTLSEATPVGSFFCLTS